MSSPPCWATAAGREDDVTSTEKKGFPGRYDRQPAQQDDEHELESVIAPESSASRDDRALILGKRKREYDDEDVLDARLQDGISTTRFETKKSGRPKQRGLGSTPAIALVRGGAAAGSSSGWSCFAVPCGSLCHSAAMLAFSLVFLALWQMSLSSVFLQLRKVASLPVEWTQPLMFVDWGHLPLQNYETCRRPGSKTKDGNGNGKENTPRSLLPLQTSDQAQKLHLPFIFGSSFFGSLKVPARPTLFSVLFSHDSKRARVRLRVREGESRLSWTDLNEAEKKPSTSGLPPVDRDCLEEVSGASTKAIAAPKNPATSDEKQVVPTVAFLFLLIRDLETSRMWSFFFEREWLPFYRVYVHQADGSISNWEQHFAVGETVPTLRRPPKGMQRISDIHVDRGGWGDQHREKSTETRDPSSTFARRHRHGNKSGPSPTGHLLSARSGESGHRRLFAKHIPYVVMERQFSGWCALLSVQVAMFQRALAEKTNRFFVLLSQNHAPLLPFPQYFQNLFAGGDTSRLCFAGRGGVDAPSSCSYAPWPGWGGRYILKHHQWLILNRAHAAKLSVGFTRELFWNYRRLYTFAPMCSDEVVPALELLDGRVPGFGEFDAVLEREGIKQECTTFAFWKGCLYQESAILRHFVLGEEVAQHGGTVTVESLNNEGEGGGSSSPDVTRKSVTQLDHSLMTPSDHGSRALAVDDNDSEQVEKMHKGRRLAIQDGMLQYDGKRNILYCNYSHPFSLSLSDARFDRWSLTEQDDRGERLTRDAESNGRGSGRKPATTGSTSEDSRREKRGFVGPTSGMSGYNISWVKAHQKFMSDYGVHLHSLLRNSLFTPEITDESIQKTDDASTISVKKDTHPGTLLIKNRGAFAERLVRSGYLLARKMGPFPLISFWRREEQQSLTATTLLQRLGIDSSDPFADKSHGSKDERKGMPTRIQRADIIASRDKATAHALPRLPQVPAWMNRRIAIIFGYARKDDLFQDGQVTYRMSTLMLHTWDYIEPFPAACLLWLITYLLSKFGVRKFQCRLLSFCAGVLAWGELCRVVAYLLKLEGRDWILSRVEDDDL
ncbi:unnamed protein product [Amoebophrya sp. A25]|nr:unnamed protein product [Amoebophrya sp. A25]|eukprot:GSA25T00007635001.1